MDKNDIRKKLPDVGSVVYIRVGEEDLRQTVQGTVIYVNRSHLYYCVRYTMGDCQLHECFSPKPKRWSEYRDAATWGAGNHHAASHNKDGHNVPRAIRIIETGKIIPSVNEAATVLGISPTSIRRILAGKQPKRPDIPDFRYAD